ncbi:hypothetical protein ABEB36_014886 [Hypothenemus hampei]|uniref:FLYWCH-type domain-containing protein n=1 Tax=Hypothenemus hampei TaxID=57062 RepID=A0ABD1E155_HYPHA
MNQIYKFLRQERSTKVWNCFKSECSASCHTQKGKVTVRFGLHNHATPTALIKQRRKENRIIIKIRAPNVNYRDILMVQGHLGMSRPPISNLGKIQRSRKPFFLLFIIMTKGIVSFE